MAFSSSSKSLGKDTRSVHTLQAAVSRDYDRQRLAAKHELKLEKDYGTLERKMISHAKWNQRAENNNLRPNVVNNRNPSPTPTSLDDFIQREKIKQDNMINSKRLGNGNIRRASMNTIPKM
ncbi:unnamed protein product [Adineta ricciae]|nr:unnamed protein product [Adineta ricciae]